MKLFLRKKNMTATFLARRFRSSIKQGEFDFNSTIKCFFVLFLVEAIHKIVGKLLSKNAYICIAQWITLSFSLSIQRPSI